MHRPPSASEKAKPASNHGRDAEEMSQRKRVNVSHPRTICFEDVTFHVDRDCSYQGPGALMHVSGHNRVLLETAQRVSLFQENVPVMIIMSTTKNAL